VINQPVLVCELGALSVEERTRRSTVAARVSARFREVRETSDGYAARLDPDTQVVEDALDWLLLERRCCPFLRLELDFEPSAGPVWLRFGGGPGVKEFLGAAGLKVSPSHEGAARSSPASGCESDRTLDASAGTGRQGLVPGPVSYASAAAPLGTASQSGAPTCAALSCASPAADAPRPCVSQDPRLVCAIPPGASIVGRRGASGPAHELGLHHDR
jgi:hypothetical protein